jgi:hypothetical protein
MLNANNSRKLQDFTCKPRMPDSNGVASFDFDGRCFCFAGDASVQDFGKKYIGTYLKEPL